MSSKSADHPVICPNCGSTATGNYCAQCGQATHLHKDTFWGLVTHFIAHYFHFESKFWQTMRTLMARPGALTVAYLAKQRARYVPPMSLYIFVAVAFFLLSPLISSGYKKLGWTSSRKGTVVAETRPTHPPETEAEATLTKMTDRLDAASTDPQLRSKLQSYVPKVFFVMIPVLALILRLLLLRNPHSTFVVNSIFALHFQAAAFIFRLAKTVLPFLPGFVFALASILYLVLALRKVYALKTGRAIGVALAASVLYVLALSIIVVTLIVVVSSLRAG
jgi:hypothetical protein